MGFGLSVLLLLLLVLGSLSHTACSCLREPFFAASFWFTLEFVDFCGDLSVSEHLTGSILRLGLLPVGTAGFVWGGGSGNGCELGADGDVLALPICVSPGESKHRILRWPELGIADDVCSSWPGDEDVGTFLVAFF